MQDLIPNDWSSEPLATGGLRQSNQLGEHLKYEPGEQVHFGQIGGKDVGFEGAAHTLIIGGSRGGKGKELSGTLFHTQKNLFHFSTKCNEVTKLAPRHGLGDREHCDGLGKLVVVLDATGNAVGVGLFLAWFNPIGGKGGFLDPDSLEFCERADRIAYCIKPRRANENNPYFPNDMRHLISAVSKHVASDLNFDYRDMITVASLVRQGDIDCYNAMCEAEPESEFAMPRDEKGEPIYDPHQVLFLSMMANPAGGGTIAESGAYFMRISKSSDQFAGVLGEAVSSLSWLQGEKMQRLFRGDPEHEFKFEEFKTNPDGVACFFAMEETNIEMGGAAPRLAFSMLEAVLKTPGKTASGRKNLIWLDEFAGLGRMDTIEHGMASIAGYSGGTQLVLIVQSAAQLSSNRTYTETGLRVLLSGCTLKIIIDVREIYTAKLTKEMLGEKEVITLQRSITRGRGTHQSKAYGMSQAYSDNWGATAGGNLSGEKGDVPDKKSNSLSRNNGASHQRGANRQRTSGSNENEAATLSEQRHVRPVLGVDEIMDRYAVHNPNGHRALELLERRAAEGPAALLVLEPGHALRIVTVPFEPTLHGGPLAVVLLLVGRYAEIDCDHGSIRVHPIRHTEPETLSPVTQRVAMKLTTLNWSFVEVFCGCFHVFASWLHISPDIMARSMSSHLLGVADAFLFRHLPQSSVAKVVGRDFDGL